MAAGQQKKRLTSSNLHEQYRGKKKKKHQLDPSDYVLNFISHVQLEWDDSLKRAIAKREQVGVTWTDMAPFIDSPPRHYSSLADVFSVPQAIFDLDNLMEVLSYEVWAKFLSESDRKLLTQFLPSGTSREQVLKPLLMGDNHHFGNPFLKWSTSLCSGGLHPDKILQKELQVRADKEAYYSELKKYHNNMLEVLKKLKEQWAIRKDSEIPWRSFFLFNYCYLKIATFNRRQIWSHFCPLFNISTLPQSTGDLWGHNSLGKAYPKEKRMGWNLAVMAIAWSIWLERNYRCFHNKQRVWSGIIRGVAFLLLAWFEAISDTKQQQLLHMESIARRSMAFDPGGPQHEERNRDDFEDELMGHNAQG